MTKKSYRSESQKAVAADRALSARLRAEARALSMLDKFVRENRYEKEHDPDPAVTDEKETRGAE